MLFVRTTRSVELTPAGSALLERARRALAEVDAAITDARDAAQTDRATLSIGCTPFSRMQVAQIADEVERRRPGIQPRLDEDVTPELLRRVAAHELTAAAVLETPSAARRYGVRIDSLRDEPLLAALPAEHRYARADAIPMHAFATERILLPREPPGRVFNDWLRAVVRATGFEIEHTIETLSAPWDRRVLPVAHGEAVSVIVAEWVLQPIAGVAAVPFDPPLSIPLDLASSRTDSGDCVAEVARRLRDAEGWLTHRRARTELPGD